MELAIPGFGTLRLEHLVLDYNGTLALDGHPLPGVKARLKRLARLLRFMSWPQRVACIGNGRNDRLMLRAAALGIVVLRWTSYWSRGGSWLRFGLKPLLFARKSAI